MSSVFHEIISAALRGEQGRCRCRAGLCGAADTDPVWGMDLGGAAASRGGAGVGTDGHGRACPWCCCQGVLWK